MRGEGRRSLWWREGSTLSHSDKVGRVSLGGLNNRRFAKQKRETSQLRPLRAQKENGHPFGCPFLFGGREGTRTPDLLRVKQAL